jgi:hypothetical protein
MQASVFIVSYPATSAGLPSGVKSARRAFEQWLGLCDHITRAGGTILVLDPPAAESAAALAPGDLLATARLGGVFVGARPDGTADAIFLRAHSSGPPAAADSDPLCAQLRRFGLRLRDAGTRWGGQAEVLGLPRNRYVLSYGPRSEAASCDEVAACLPLASHTLRVEVSRDSGLGAITYLQTRGGNGILFFDSSVMQNMTFAQVSTFVGDKVQVVSIGGDDAAAGATQIISVHGTALVPPGISTTLRGQLWRMGFQVVEVDLGALGGPEVGIGPRAFVVAWPQCLLDDTLPTYATRRAELFQRLEQLPEA